MQSIKKFIILIAFSFLLTLFLFYIVNIFIYYALLFMYEFFKIAPWNTDLDIWGATMSKELKMNKWNELNEMY